MKKQIKPKDIESDQLEEKIEEGTHNDILVDNSAATKSIGEKKSFPMGIIIGVIVLVLGIAGFFVVKGMFSAPKTNTANEESMFDETLSEIDPSIEVNISKGKTQDNSILISAKGLNSKYSSISYELQYDSEGVGKGVTSGSKPIDVTGQDMFSREIYLGTCSKNVCKPDLGIQKVSVILIFTDVSDKRTQYLGEYKPE